MLADTPKQLRAVFVTIVGSRGPQTRLFGGSLANPYIWRHSRVQEP